MPHDFEWPAPPGFRLPLEAATRPAGCVAFLGDGRILSGTLEHDRRRIHLTVTAAGRRALADIESARHKANRSLFTGLSPAERRQLLRSLLACLERLWKVDQSGDVAPDPTLPARRRNT